MAGMVSETAIFMGGGGPGHAQPQELLLKLANRHGLIAGATGTGKTVTLQVLAEAFSTAGVPVFLADVKGDLAGLACPGSDQAKPHAAFAERAATIGYDLAYRAFPVTFWDLYGNAGHPVRMTLAEMGPLLLSRLLDLSPVQEGVLNIAFRMADDEGLALLDLKDLQAMLVYLGENARAIGLRYGNVSAASVGAIQRQLMVLENQGAGAVFGEPALQLADLIACDSAGLGRINILAADRLMAAPRLYACFLLWLLSELFEDLPERGDPEKPVFALVFDEAHLLFDDAPKALVDKIEQVARLIRSKGVSLWFVTQNPADLPESVLGQLGNRVQHALRAFTGADQRALARAAQTYRANPAFDTETAIREVGTGEAVTSFLERKGAPGMVERTLIRPPASRLGAISAEERAAVIAQSGLGARYDQPIDRMSAHERLADRAEAAARAAAESEGQDTPQDTEDTGEFRRARRYDGALGKAGSSRMGRAKAGSPPASKPRARQSDSMAEVFGKSVARQLGRQLGNSLVRGILGGLFKSR